MPEYFLTKKAVEDLSQIWDYTFETWNEKQADKYYGILIHTCKELSENPELGKHYDEIATGILGYRANNHIIFYKIVGELKIEVIRVLHGRMDLDSRIKE